MVTAEMTIENYVQASMDIVEDDESRIVRDV